MQSSYPPLITGLATLLWISLFSCVTALPGPPCDANLDGAKCIRARPNAAVANARISQSVNVARPRELTDPYYYRVPAVYSKRLSSQILKFSNWGDELVFDDAQDAVVAGEDWTVDDQKIHHDAAMPRSKTWTIESAQLIAMNDVRVDGMTHSEVVRALKALTTFGHQFHGFWKCDIELHDTSLTVSVRGRFKLQEAPSRILSLPPTTPGSASAQ
ncbi:MAG: hypothetical protein LQ344_007175 [Seirophora lacunosa]|nr:MAG: hypothetical protein LQ344_007175 [Seirophora lacunosa]